MKTFVDDALPLSNQFRKAAEKCRIANYYYPNDRKEAAI